MAHSPQDVYARRLASRRGYPLWTPEPNMSLPPVYIQEGLKIGDVGVVVPEDGSFDVFFNLCMPPDHPLHGDAGVPDNFNQILLSGRDISQFPKAESAGRIISTPSVARVRSRSTTSEEDIERREQPGPLDYEFTLSSRDGAVLILPEGAERYYLRNERLFMDAAMQHAVGWYAFAEQRLGRIISHDSLYLITGFYKARSWSLAAYQQGASASQASARFRAVQVGRGNIETSYTWETTLSMDWRAGPEDRYYQGTANQSIFIQGYKISIREGILGRKRIRVRADPAGRSHRLAFLGSSLFSRVRNRISRSRSNSTTSAPKGAGTSLNKDTGENDHSIDERGNVREDVTIERFPQVSESFHPSDIINQHLLQEFPSATVAVTHDSRWMALLERGFLSHEELTQADRLIAAVESNYSAVLTREGAVYFQSRTTESGNETEINLVSVRNPEISPDFLGPYEHTSSESLAPSEPIAPDILEPTESTNVREAINVVLFGEPGVGKSSVVNLISRRDIAKVPSDASSFALQSTRFDTRVDDMNLCIFETIGLDGPEIRRDDYLAVRVKAYEFVHKLSAAGGVHLLLFCVRATRLTPATRCNYQLFSEVFFQGKVPTALVITGLEEELEMEDWWTQNKVLAEDYGLAIAGHACITTVTNHTPHQDRNYAESQKTIRELMKNCYLKTPAPLPEAHVWFLRLGSDMQQFIEKHWQPTRRDLLDMLLKHLDVDPKTSQKLLDAMEQRGTQKVDRGGTLPEEKYLGSDGGVGSHEARTVLSDDGKLEPTRSPRILDSRKDKNPLRMTAAGEEAMNQYSDAEMEGEQSGKWSGEVRREKMWTGKIQVEPGKADTPYGMNEVDLSMEDIRSNFPHDLTDYVTRTDKFPFASGDRADIYRGQIRVGGRTSTVAIKVHKMYLQDGKSFADRMKQFQREIIIWLRLQHPNILPLFGTIRDPLVHADMPALVFPFVENGDLSGYLARNRGLGTTKRLILVNDVASGLQYLHSQYIVHGDLSGSNVLVNAGGNACIADFGLSTSLTTISGRTFKKSRRDGSAVRWMDPKLLAIDGSDTTPTTRSDVYSFGSIMLQILTGDIPYCHIHYDARIIAAILRGDRPERSDQTAVTDSRWSFIERCWSPGEDRPSSDEIVRFAWRELAESTSVQD